MAQIKFEKQFGKGVDPWYAKAERLAKKRKFPISFLALVLIEYLKKVWVNVKVENTMRSVDADIEKNQHIATTGKAKERQSVSAGPGAPPTLHDAYREVSQNERTAAEQALTALQTRKKFLQKSIEIYSGPAAGSGTATEAYK